MKEKILVIINKILENRSREKQISLAPEMHLRNDIGFDSLDLAELTVRVEAEYSIDIFEDGIVNTVGEIFQKLEAK
jgi:acyl carrier protein